MNVQIKHQATTITSRVISYNRQHQICTSIGTCDITLEGTYATPIQPFQTFDIYENGDFKVRYYVSDIQKEIPSGTISVHCQDKSKYLTDYFISSTYLIDYPSYTRYWIEKFLTEAGVSYNFITSSQGNLISNDTTLGLQSAYDQVMMLLQLSGWYMYFDGNGVAVIGSLDTDLASSAGHLGKTDILEIKRITDDNMLRNRAVVWGQYDVLNREYAYADVSKNTPWNYDSVDKRAMVISNNNIPNKSSAYNIANILLKEFAKVTIEKHITAWGARNFNLGEMVTVNSNIWRGKGMITTFGVTMDRNGLVTNLILDERCPRLFGFFNFGDYVYISTFGDGIWRKHIKFDPTWYNFSTGLTDLNITDLHINNGIFGSVGHSGALYYASNEEGPWNQITLTGLDSSLEDDVPSGEMVTYVPFSGIMARAVIVDKEVNTVKFGVDNWSGLNTGDYFLSYSGGISVSGGGRSWIVEYDPYTGNLVGEMGSGIYPVNYSGNYNLFVVDIENDGLNDYISVGGGNGSGVFTADGYDLGRYTTAPIIDTYDTNAIVPAPVQNFTGTNRTIGINADIGNENAIVFFDDALTSSRYFVAVKQNGDIYKTEFSLNIDGETVNSSTTTKAFISSTDVVLGIHKLANEVETYRVYYRKSWSTDRKIYYKEWDYINDTVSSEITVFTSTVGNVHNFSWNVNVAGKLHFMYHTMEAPAMVGGQNTHQQTLRLYFVIIDLETSSVLQNSLIYSYATQLRSGSTTQYEYFPPASHNIANLFFGNEFIKFGLFQDGDVGIKIIGWFEHGYIDWTEHLIVGNQNGVSDTVLKNSGAFRFSVLNLTGTGRKATTQLTRTWGLLSFDGSAVSDAFATNGSEFITYTGNAPYYVNNITIYPIYSRSQPYYIAIDSSTSEFWVCEPASLQPVSVINEPPNLLLRHPFSHPTTFGDAIYWFVQDTTFFDKKLAKTPTIFDVSSSIIYDISLNTTTFSRGMNVGGFFLHALSLSSTTPITYVYWIGEELEFPSYLVLQRDGSDFHLIQQSSKPIRIDISNNSPVLTVRDVENTFQSNFVFANELTQVIPAGVLDSTREVRDYRYALLESVSGVATASGLGVETQILYVNASGIFTADTNTYSGGFSLYTEIPSGSAERIETSNYTYPGQFIFVTTSGDDPTFYQKDNDGFIFVEYSGIPDSRVTRIRLDDRF